VFVKFHLKEEAFLFEIDINTFICYKVSVILNLTQEDDKLNVLCISLGTGLTFMNHINHGVCAQAEISTEKSPGKPNL